MDPLDLSLEQIHVWSRSTPTEQGLRHLCHSDREIGGGRGAPSGVNEKGR
jgi:hypothetical protein